MPIRLRAMSLDGKLSLGYLLVVAFLFVTTIPHGQSPVWMLWLLGFPLLYAPWVFQQAAGDLGPMSPAVGVSIYVLLWVANAYLWGHTAAAVARWQDRRSGFRVTSRD